MSRRLQVVLRDDEIGLFARAAADSGLTLSEWVRQSLRRTQRSMSTDSPDAKLKAVRQAYESRFPVADIERMLAEIGEGYITDEGP